MSGKAGFSVWAVISPSDGATQGLFATEKLAEEFVRAMKEKNPWTSLLGVDEKRVFGELPYGLRAHDPLPRDEA